MAIGKIYPIDQKGVQGIMGYLFQHSPKRIEFDL